MRKAIQQSVSINLIFYLGKITQNMADFNLYFPKAKQLEGTVYENVPGDNGGCTKYGLTTDDLHEAHLDLNNDAAFDCEDVMLLSDLTASMVLKKLYWDFFNADGITNQNLAEFIVDGGLNQGRILIAKYVQKIVGFTYEGIDGIVGNKTLAAINAASPDRIFLQLKRMRMNRYYNIVIANPSQQKFKEGWFNRVDAFSVA